MRLSKVLTGNDLGRLAGLAEEPTQDDFEAAVAWLKERGENPLDLDSLTSRELGAQDLLGWDKLREAAALLLL